LKNIQVNQRLLANRHHVINGLNQPNERGEILWREFDIVSILVANTAPSDNAIDAQTKLHLSGVIYPTGNDHSLVPLSVKRKAGINGAKSERHVPKGHRRFDRVLDLREIETRHL